MYIRGWDTGVQFSRINIIDLFLRVIDSTNGLSPVDYPSGHSIKGLYESTLCIYERQQTYW